MQVIKVQINNIQDQINAITSRIDNHSFERKKFEAYVTSGIKNLLSKIGHIENQLNASEVEKARIEKDIQYQRRDHDKLTDKVEILERFFGEKIESIKTTMTDHYKTISKEFKNQAEIKDKKNWTLILLLVSNIFTLILTITK